MVNKNKEMMLISSSIFFKDFLLKIGRDQKKPMGRFNPSAWFVEITRGCNLNCGFCATALFPRNEFHFMPRDTWIQMCSLIQQISPFGRLELAQAGEPLLHPYILQFLRTARRIIPRIQLMTYTNGTQLINKKISYKELFDAGINIVLVDMYSLEEDHVQLAEKSGFQFFVKEKAPKDAPRAWDNHHNPDLKLIVLMNHPGNWSNIKKRAVKMSTFFNNLDWKRAEKYGLKPIIEAPNRRCDQPAKYVNIGFDGTYSFCCFDFMRQVYGKLGDVSTGVDGFFKFWFGEYMQFTRKLLHNKKRRRHEFCSMCSFTGNHCDIPWWPESLYDQFWTGSEWRDTPRICKIND